MDQSKEARFAKLEAMKKERELSDVVNGLLACRDSFQTLASNDQYNTILEKMNSLLIIAKEYVDNNQNFQNICKELDRRLLSVGQSLDQVQHIDLPRNNDKVRDTLYEIIKILSDQLKGEIRGALLQ